MPGNSLNDRAARSRILSGMRPTGKLHLGNYMGALRNWVRLQGETDENGEPKYDCYFFIADYHALTTDYADPSQLQQNTLDVALDWLAAGLDPEKSTIFVQSHVPEHAELHLLFSMITPLGWLERVPSYKDQQENITGKDLTTYGFLGYPLLQAADILLYRPHFVPVGADQVAHVELTREVARRFNYLYPLANQERLFPEPDTILTVAPKVPGIDGRKMSKSYANTINLQDSPTAVVHKVAEMSKAGQRPTLDVPGDPDICPVGQMHTIFSSDDVNKSIRQGCTEASIHCHQCKMYLAESINAELQPMRYRRQELESGPRGNTATDRLESILIDGSARARELSSLTFLQARAQMGLLVDFKTSKFTWTWNEDLKEASGPVRYDLSASRHWLKLDESIRNKNVVDYWRVHVLPSRISWKSTSGFAYITEKGKRVIVAAALEVEPDYWQFQLPRKTYEIVVLLPLGKDMTLDDFVIPQKLYREAWTKWPKLEKVIPVHLTREGASWKVAIGDDPSFDVTELHSNYRTVA